MRGRIVHCIQINSNQDQPKQTSDASSQIVQWKITRCPAIKTVDLDLNFKMLGFLNIFNCALSLKSIGSWIERQWSCKLCVVGDLELTDVWNIVSRRNLLQGYVNTAHYDLKFQGRSFRIFWCLQSLVDVVTHGSWPKFNKQYRSVLTGLTQNNYYLERICHV